MINMATSAPLHLNLATSAPYSGSAVVQHLSASSVSQGDLARELDNLALGGAPSGPPPGFQPYPTIAPNILTLGGFQPSRVQPVPQYPPPSMARGPLAYPLPPPPPVYHQQGSGDGRDFNDFAEEEEEKETVIDMEDSEDFQSKFKVKALNKLTPHIELSEIPEKNKFKGRRPHDIGGLGEQGHLVGVSSFIDMFMKDRVIGECGGEVAQAEKIDQDFLNNAERTLMDVRAGSLEDILKEGLKDDIQSEEPVSTGVGEGVEHRINSILGFDVSFLHNSNVGVVLV